jgi:hypothetical protein
MLSISSQEAIRKKDIIDYCLVSKVCFRQSVIPRLDRGIYYFQWVMDHPVKPEDD